MKFRVAAGALLLVTAFGVGWLLGRDVITPWLNPPVHKEAHRA